MDLSPSLVASEPKAPPSGTGRAVVLRAVEGEAGFEAALRTQADFAAGEPARPAPLEELPGAVALDGDLEPTPEGLALHAEPLEIASRPEPEAGLALTLPPRPEVRAREDSSRPGAPDDGGTNAARVAEATTSTVTKGTGSSASPEVLVASLEAGGEERASASASAAQSLGEARASNAQESAPLRGAPEVPRPIAADAPLAADVLRQVRIALDARRRSATIRLEPRELGRLSIRVEVENGHVRAVVRADSARTLELLGAHLPELRASFGLLGLEADELDLALSSERDPRQAPEHQARGETPKRATPSRDELRPTHELHLEPAQDFGPGLDTYA